MIDKSTDHGNDVMVPFLAISSLKPGSALWGRREKIGVGEKKKKKSASERERMRSPSLLPRIPLSSLRLPIFFLFDPGFWLFLPLRSPVQG